MTAGKSGQAATRWPGHRFALILACVALFVGIGFMALSMRSAALPPEATGKVLAVFPPGTDSDDIFAGLIRAGGKPLRKTWLDFVWVVSSSEPGFAGRLKAEGAIGTYAEMPITPQLAGCFAYADAKVVQLFQVRP